MSVAGRHRRVYARARVTCDINESYHLKFNTHTFTHTFALLGGRWPHSHIEDDHEGWTAGSKYDVLKMYTLLLVGFR